MTNHESPEEKREKEDPAPHPADDPATSADAEVDEHLPEWQRIFGRLRREAEELWPDGRVRILVPTRRRRPRQGGRR